MSQWLRVLAAPAEVLGLVPSIPISIRTGQLTTNYLFQFQGICRPLLELRGIASTWCTYYIQLRHTQIYIENLFNVIGFSLVILELGHILLNKMAHIF